MTYNLAVSVEGVRKVFIDFPASLPVEAAVSDIAEIYGVAPRTVKIRNIVEIS